MGSNAVAAAIIIIWGNATLAGKDPASVKFLAPQVAEMRCYRIGKEFARDRHCRLSYGKFIGLIYAISFIHAIDI